MHKPAANFPLPLVVCAALTAVSGCVQAQAPEANPLAGPAEGNVVQTVARPVSHTPELQETPSVLLPGTYYDTTRTPLTAGAMAPDFTLPLASDCHWTPAGKTRDTTPGETLTISLKSFLAPQPGKRANSEKPRKATVLIFWAFWCDTWKDVTRDFKKLCPQLADLGAGVLCVAVDASQQPVARRAFAAKEIWFPVVIDTHGGAGQGHAEDDVPETTTTRRRKPATSHELSIGATFGVRRVPTFFVLDATGRIRTRFEGYPGGRRMLQAVREAKRPVVGKDVGVGK